MKVRSVLIAVFAVAVVAPAQTISNVPPPAVGFIDISTTGGTQITGISDDSIHLINTTIGNSLFPAGAVYVGNNGYAISGVSGGGFSNADILATGATPTGMPAAATGILMPHWDDLYPTTAAPPTQIWWQELGGVLFIMWKDENHFNSTAANEGITFEIQVFQGPIACGSPAIQFLYNDTVFGGAQAVNDNGASATVGYAHGAIAGLGNAKWSFNTAGSISAGLCLSISGGSFTMNITSPFGPGSLQIDLNDGSCTGSSYILPLTFNAGAFPNGWLGGIDIPVPELLAELNFGFPFVGPLPGAFTIGPFTGLPSGIPFYTVAWAVDAFGVPTLKASAQTYTLP